MPPLWFLILTFISPQVQNPLTIMFKNPFFLALTSGILLGLAWPTYGISLIIFVAFVPLLLAEKEIRLGNAKRKKIKVFLAAYITFVVWNGITTWWLWYSSAFGMFFAILVNALLMALLFLIYHFVARKLPQKIHLVFLPALWMAFEKFHLNWDFSWPWLNLGNVFSDDVMWIQWYEYTGTFGGALWIWIVNIGLFKTFDKYHQLQNKTLLARGVAKNLLCIAFPIIVSLVIWSNYKESSQKANIVLLQPNIDPYTEKYDTVLNSNVKIANKLKQLALPELTPETDFVIAPETVLAEGSSIDGFLFSEEKRILQELTIGRKDLTLILGADFFRLYRQKDKPTPTANPTSRGDWYDVYNAAVELDATDSVNIYIKSKLVVGVENFPFKNVLEPILGNVMLNLGGTVASRAVQKDRTVFVSRNGNYKGGPIICYESVYGEFVTSYVHHGANFLSIITNDAWWDNTQGHKQHLSYASLRAIETRRSIARSANTGISAFIDEKGSVLKRIAYEQEGALSGTITINNKKTFYVTYGDYIARIAALVAGLIFLFAIARKKG